MIRHIVAYEEAAKADLYDIYAYIAREAGLDVADDVVSRLRTCSEALEYAPQRGRARSDLKPGLRMVTFENCVTIAYLIGDGRVDILRYIYRGRLMRPEMF